MFVIIALSLISFILIAPGTAFPFQNIQLKDRPVLVGSMLGAAPGGLAILTYEPRRVIVVDPDDLISTAYCAIKSNEMMSKRTLVDIIKGDHPWRPPPCA